MTLWHQMVETAGTFYSYAAPTNPEAGNSGRAAQVEEFRLEGGSGAAKISRLLAALRSCKLEWLRLSSENEQLRAALNTIAREDAHGPIGQFARKTLQHKRSIGRRTTQ